MVVLTTDGSSIAVAVDGAPFGTVRLSDDPYHSANRYADLSQLRLEPAIAAELLWKLAKLAGRPLQIMVSSEDTQAAEFLIAGGAVCKRKCYEVETRMEDYIGEAVQAPLLHAHVGQPEYDRCCEIMYERYRETHAPINPWTAELSDFRDHLPSEAAFTVSQGQVSALAFVEDSEIAYIYSSGKDALRAFAASLTGRMFSTHETISFESDSCDWAAMELKAMFIDRGGPSFDTYVYDLTTTAR